MQYFKNVFILAFSVALISGCGPKPKPTPLPSKATNEVIKNIPDWYKTPPDDPNFLYGRGSEISRDMQISMDGATEAARLEIAKTLEVRFQGLTKRFSEEVGLGSDSEILKQFTQATKSVVSQVMVGSKAVKSDILNENGLFRSYALVELPLGEANLALLNQIKANQSLYTRIRTFEVFKELEDEVTKYEEWKASQTPPPPTPPGQ